MLPLHPRILPVVWSSPESRATYRADEFYEPVVVPRRSIWLYPFLDIRQRREFSFFSLEHLFFMQFPARRLVGSHRSPPYVGNGGSAGCQPTDHVKVQLLRLQLTCCRARKPACSKQPSPPAPGSSASCTLIQYLPCPLFLN